MGEDSSKRPDAVRQRNEEHGASRLTVRGVLRDVVHHVLELDYPLLRTVAGLARNPGGMARAYVQAPDRSRWTNPVKFSFGAAAISVAATHVFNVKTVAVTAASMPGADPEVARHIDAALEWHFNWMHVIFLATLPAMVLPLRLCFGRAGLNVAEHSVFAMYAMGFCFLLWVPIVPFDPTSHPVLSLLYMLVTVGYMCWAACGFYGGRWWQTSALILLAFVGYYVLYSALVVISTFVYVVYMQS